VTFAFFNTDRAPINQTLVRKAIAAVIDRQLLIDLMLTGEEQPATTIIPPGMRDPSASEEDIGIQFDPAQARAWLADAGYPDGKGFPTLQLVVPPKAPYPQLAQAIQDLLHHYLQITVQYHLGSAEDDQTAHMTLITSCPELPTGRVFLNIFHPANDTFLKEWTDSEFADEYISIMEQMRGRTDREAMHDLSVRAEQILIEDEAFMLPLYFNTAHCLVAPRVQGWFHMALGGQHIRNWSLEE
jgi:oligopeptide transport system substrate-binding protein